MAKRELLKFLMGAYTTERPIFACISGSRAYGFPTISEDIDIRACHIAPTRALLGLRKPAQVIERKQNNYDFVSYEIEKFIGLILKGNGNALENLYTRSFFITDIGKKLRALGKDCITKAIYPHYRGFAYQIYKRAEAKNFMSPKEILYVYRVLLTGINALQNGKIEVNIKQLPLKGLTALHRVVDCISKNKFEQEFPRLKKKFEHDSKILFHRLDDAKEMSKLPERPTEETVKKLEKFLIKIRKENFR